MPKNNILLAFRLNIEASFLGWYTKMLSIFNHAIPCNINSPRWSLIIPSLSLDNFTILLFFAESWQYIDRWINIALRNNSMNLVKVKFSRCLPSCQLSRITNSMNRVTVEISRCMLTTTYQGREEHSPTATNYSLSTRLWGVHCAPLDFR